MAQFILFHSFLPPNTNFFGKSDKELHEFLKALRESSLNKILKRFPMIKKLGVDSTMSFVELPDETEKVLVGLLRKEHGCLLFKVVL
jgi:hypothetical protein